MRYVPGVKMSGCTGYIYSWVEIIIDAERTRGYSVYTTRKHPSGANQLFSIAKDLKWNVYRGITADSMDETDFERIRNFIKKHERPEHPVKADNHNAIRDMLQKIGDYEGKYTETEYRTEIGNIDVVWKRTKASIPSHAIEVQIRGNLYQALAKLQYA